ncbi:MAG: outer membrane beta-barrel protein [Saprospiraceae bacterium]|nr:outer membrane beta-barrel protein [Saprospiraceae bacterium]MBK7738406.1 outer membrane beta-barrel protein [Saprospiraceae bacterium]
MSKQILILFLFLNSKLLFGQFNFKLSVGLNLTNYELRMISPTFKKDFKQYYKYRVLYNGGVEIEYEPKPNLSIVTGLNLDYRGSKNYAYPPPFRDYVLAEYTFVEIPILFKYKFLPTKFYIGSGFNLNKRVGSNSITYEEYNHPYGFDFKSLIGFKLFNRTFIQTAYTFGNIDKWLFGKYDYHMFHVFSINIQYTFFKF